MTIDKQIEREARAIEYKQEVDLYSDTYEGLVGYEYAYDLMVSLKIEAYKNGYNKAKEEFEHSSRWRKVSEGLPEYGSIIVAKGDTSDFQDMYLIEIDSDYSMSVLTSYYKEWKPID